MVFSDGRLLALESSSFEDDKVTLRDVLTGKSIAPLPRWGRVEDWDLSPDGSLLALESSDGAIELWDVSSRKHVATIDAPHVGNEDTPTGYDYVVASLAFSPDGRLLASGGQGGHLLRWRRPRRLGCGMCRQANPSVPPFSGVLLFPQRQAAGRGNGGRG